MKKNTLALALLLVAPAVSAKTFGEQSNAADNLIQFKKMESHHKSEWLEFANKNHNNKLNMINQQQKDWTGFGINKIGQLKQNGNNEAVFAQSLNKAIALHKKHKEQWKKWSEEMYRDAKKLAEKHDRELDTFEKNIQK